MNDRDERIKILEESIEEIYRAGEEILSAQLMLNELIADLSFGQSIEIKNNRGKIVYFFWTKKSEVRSLLRADSIPALYEKLKKSDYYKPQKKRA